jgi:hypothetical protein
MKHWFLHPTLSIFRFNRWSSDFKETYRALGIVEKLSLKRGSAVRRGMFIAKSISQPAKLP